jgi:hypothetical protein
MKRLAVCLLFLAFIISGSLFGERQFTSAQLFDKYRAVFSAGPVSTTGLETLVPLLKKDGFITSDGITWKMADASGSVVLIVLSTSNSLYATYSPLIAVPLGDAALAALISKADSIEVGDGDTLTISISHRSLHNQSNTGSYSEYLKFNLRGGAWQETGIFIDWSK